MTYYVTTKVTLKFGQNAGFNESMAQLAPAMAVHGWKLLYGLQPLIGDVTEVLHIWQIDKFDDIANGLNSAFSDAKLGANFAKLPAFMQGEILQIMVKTPYSP